MYSDVYFQGLTLKRIRFTFLYRQLHFVLRYVNCKVVGFLFIFIACEKTKKTMYEHHSTRWHVVLSYLSSTLFRIR